MSHLFLGPRLLHLPAVTDICKSPAEMCRAYRRNKKEDPTVFAAYQQKNKLKCWRYRQRSLTAEELKVKRERGRIRAQKYRFVIF